MCQKRVCVWDKLRKIITLMLIRNHQMLAAPDLFQEYFMWPQSVGMIGGKARKAHYSIGFQGNQLIYLDPHQCRPTVDMNGPFSDEVPLHICSPIVGYI